MDDKCWSKGGVMKSLNEIIANAEQLAPLPLTAAKLAQVIADDKSTIEDATEVVRYDQALSAFVLRVANSSFSASNRTIGNVRDAVIRLGSGRILEMLISKCVRGIMKKPLAQYGYSEDDLWRHSVASAIAAENLNRYAKINISGLSFTAALLHDIGKLLMIRGFPENEMRKIWDIMKDNHVSWADAEKELFGFTHAEVGAYMAQLWKLPEHIERAIRYHNTVDTDFDLVTDSVRVANVVARAIGQGIGFEGMSVAVDSNISERLVLSRENFEMLCADTAEKLEGVLAMYEGV